MSIVDRTVPYEILHRFDADGLLAGVHYVERRIIDLDGERIRDEVGQARPVSLVDGAAGALLVEILGEAHVSAARTAEAATAAAASAEAETARLREALSAAEVTRDQALAELNRREDEVRSLAADVEALRAELSRVSTDRDGLIARLSPG